MTVSAGFTADEIRDFVLEYVAYFTTRSPEAWGVRC